MLSRASQASRRAAGPGEAPAYWHLGENPHQREGEIATIRRGIDRGMTLIDWPRTA